MSPPWMPLYIADYMADTGHLGALESGGYLHLIMHYWRHGGLPKEDASQARIARMTPREWARCRDVILAFFDADLRHKRIDSELEKAVVKSERRSESGSRGGKAKALKNKNAPLANAKVLPEQNPAFALASSSQPESDLSLTETRKRAERASVAKEIAEEFSLRFWPIWPHKVGKPDAAKSFLSARRKGATCDEIIAGVERYVRDKPPDRPWLNPSTFLNQKRWEDEPATVEHQPRAGPSADRDYGKGALAKLIRNVDESIKNERLGQTEGEISGGNVLSLPVVPGVRGGGRDDDGDVSPFAQWLRPGSG